MSFASFSPLWAAAGIAGLAGVLFFLQRLRIRHRPVPVTTSLFWRAAAAEAPARTLREHFRHPWAYLLVLLIAALLWLAFARPQRTTSAQDTFQVLILDGSAGMAIGSRYADAVAALRHEVARLPADARQVIWCGAGVRTLLEPGEPELLLERRLAGLLPVAAPAGIEPLLRDLAVVEHPGRKTAVEIFGAAPVQPETLAALPNLVVTRAPTGKLPNASNHGLVALGVADAASGVWNHVDAFFQVAANRTFDPAAVHFAIELDGIPVAATAIHPVRGDARNGFLVSDLPAHGGMLKVRLTTEDALPFDNVARLRLPDRPRVPVRVSPSLPAIVRTALKADPRVALVDTDAAVVVRSRGETFGGPLPALEFGPSDNAQPAFLIVHPATLAAGAVLTNTADALGLKEIDATSLATTARRPIEVSVQTGPQWRIEVWRELLDDHYDFVQSRAFPIFLAKTVRWLSDARPELPHLAAGHPLQTDALDSQLQPVTSTGRVLNPLGTAYVPEVAGDLRLRSTPFPTAVALLDTDVTTLRTTPLPAPTAGVPSAHLDLVTWLLSAAFGLLMIEWYLHRTSRVP